jgi:CRP-like cAMP-binding protein
MSAEEALFQRFGKDIPKGTVLFREGDPGKEMYVIQSGKVAISKKVRDVEKVLALLGPGEFFGEMAIISNKPRNASAIIEEEARLLVIDPRTFESMIRGNAEIAVRMIKKLSARLGQANAQVETLLKQDLNHRIVHELRVLADAQGQPDGPGVRIDISIEELAVAVGAKPKEVRDGLDRLEKARLLDKQVGTIFIAEVGKLGEFLEFLEMRERFGS